MHHIIIGNGVAGITAALTIRERDRSAQITLISGESDYFFSRTALMYAFMDRMSLRDLEPLERKVYDAQKFNRIRAWVTNLDAATRTLTLDTGQTIQYDALLLATGSRPNQLTVPGAAAVKAGLANFVTLQDLESLEKWTKLGGKAAVTGGGLIGIELVECLTHHGMQVDFFVREPWYWPAALDKEEAAIVTGHIRHHGVNVYLEESVAEIKSDTAGKLTGITSSSGKQYPLDLLGVSIGVHPAIEWLTQVKTPPATKRGILTNPAFRTSLPQVWAAGDCAEIELPGAKPLIEQIWYSAKRQGELAAKSMLGDSIAYQPPIFYNSSKFFEIEFTTVGQPNAPGSETFFHPFAGAQASIRITWRDSAVTAFNMLGSRWNHEFFERWITERRAPQYVMDHLAEAQFDGEFCTLPLAEAQSNFKHSRRPR